MKSSFYLIIPEYKDSVGVSNLINSLDRLLKKNLYLQLTIVVVDDFSPIDHFLALKKIIKKNKNIILIRNKNNLGPAKSRNIGASFSTNANDILIFIDSDCEIESDNFFNIVERFFNKKNNTILTGKIIPDNKANIYSKWRFGQDLKPQPKKISIRKIAPDYFQGGFFVIKNIVFNKIGGFDEDLKSFEDFDFASRAKKMKIDCFKNDKLIIMHKNNSLKLEKDMIKNYFAYKTDLKLLVKKNIYKNIPSLLTKFINRKSKFFLIYLNFPMFVTYFLVKLISVFGESVFTNILFSHLIIASAYIGFSDKKNINSWFINILCKEYNK